MMPRALSVVLDGYSFLECPRWHDGRVWVSDFYTHVVVANDGKGHTEVISTVPNQPSGLGWLPDGRLLIVSMRDRRLLRKEPSGEVVEHADLSGLASEMLNDMVVDATGRAYVGNFGFDLMSGAPIRSAAIIRVDPDGSAQVAAEDLLFPNGTVIFDDGTLVVAESFGQRLSAFDVGEDGGLGNRRVWAAFGDPPATDSVAEALVPGAVAPDGIGADAEGAIWMADALGHRVLRVREGGEILEEVSTGDMGVYACMLGGDDGRTLFMCAAPTFAEHERRETREAQLLSCRVDVPHAGLP
jgi:sugar lactone lactonase YvrE